MQAVKIRKELIASDKEISKEIMYGDDNDDK
jgi:hypothetical protein